MAFSGRRAIRSGRRLILQNFLVCAYQEGRLLGVRFQGPAVDEEEFHEFSTPLRTPTLVHRVL